MCQSKATHNLLLRNKQPIYNGKMINVEKRNDDIEEYKAVCRYHYYNPILN